MGGTKWVELFITLTRRMGEPTYGLLLSLVASWWGGFRGLFSASCTEGSSLDVLRRLSRGKYITLCASRGQRALNGSVLLLVTEYLT